MLQRKMFKMQKNVDVTNVSQVGLTNVNVTIVNGTNVHVINVNVTIANVTNVFKNYLTLIEKNLLSMQVF